MTILAYAGLTDSIVKKSNSSKANKPGSPNQFSVNNLDKGASIGGNLQKRGDRRGK